MHALRHVDLDVASAFEVVAKELVEPQIRPLARAWRTVLLEPPAQFAGFADVVPLRPVADYAELYTPGTYPVLGNSSSPSASRRTGPRRLHRNSTAILTLSMLLGTDSPSRSAAGHYFLGLNPSSQQAPVTWATGNHLVAVWVTHPCATFVGKDVASPDHPSG